MVWGQQISSLLSLLYTFERSKHKVCCLLVESGVNWQDELQGPCILSQWLYAKKGWTCLGALSLKILYLIACRLTRGLIAFLTSLFWRKKNFRRASNRGVISYKLTCCSWLPSPTTIQVSLLDLWQGRSFFPSLHFLNLAPYLLVCHCLSFNMVSFIQVLKNIRTGQRRPLFPVEGWAKVLMDVALWIPHDK